MRRTPVRVLRRLARDDQESMYNSVKSRQFTLLAMATDGNQVPAWTGQPFAHLMHRPAPPAAGEKQTNLAAVSVRSPSSTSYTWTTE